MRGVPSVDSFLENFAAVLKIPTYFKFHIFLHRRKNLAQFLFILLISEFTIHSSCHLFLLTKGIWVKSNSVVLLMEGIAGEG